MLRRAAGRDGRDPPRRPAPVQLPRVRRRDRPGQAVQRGRGRPEGPRGHDGSAVRRADPTSLTASLVVDPGPATPAADLAAEAGNVALHPNEAFVDRYLVERRRRGSILGRCFLCGQNMLPPSAHQQNGRGSAPEPDSAPRERHTSGTLTDANNSNEKTSDAPQDTESNGEGDR